MVRQHRNGTAGRLKDFYSRVVVADLQRKNMNNLQIFNSEEFGDIRTVQLNNEIYFVGKDVATALGYANPKNAVPTHVSEEDKLSTQIEYAGQRREVTVINESGLYALIFGSKLESAKRFKHWVTSEVLPTIRKTGSYQIPMSQVEMMCIQLKKTSKNYSF